MRRTFRDEEVRTSRWRDHDFLFLWDVTRNDWVTNFSGNYDSLQVLPAMVPPSLFQGTTPGPPQISVRCSCCNLWLSDVDSVLDHHIYLHGLGLQCWLQSTARARERSLSETGSELFRLSTMATASSLALTALAWSSNSAVICPHCHKIFACFYDWEHHVQIISVGNGYASMQWYDPGGRTLPAHAILLPAILHARSLSAACPRSRAYPVTARWIRVVYAITLAAFSSRRSAMSLLTVPVLANLLRLRWPAERITQFCPLPLFSTTLNLLTSQGTVFPAQPRTTCLHGALDMSATCEHCQENLLFFLGPDGEIDIQCCFPPSVPLPLGYGCFKCRISFPAYSEFLDHCIARRHIIPILPPHPSTLR